MSSHSPTFPWNGAGDFWSKDSSIIIQRRTFLDHQFLAILLSMIWDRTFGDKVIGYFMIFHYQLELSGFWDQERNTRRIVTGLL